VGPFFYCCHFYFYDGVATFVEKKLELLYNWRGGCGQPESDPNFYCFFANKWGERLTGSDSGTQRGVEKMEETESNLEMIKK
jgi:hypothetical protein